MNSTDFNKMLAQLCVAIGVGDIKSAIEDERPGI